MHRFKRAVGTTMKLIGWVTTAYLLGCVFTVGYFSTDLAATAWGNVFTYLWLAFGPFSILIWFATVFIASQVYFWSSFPFTTALAYLLVLGLAAYWLGLRRTILRPVS